VSEVFVVDACRTPIGKIKGALAGVRPDHLAADVIKALVERNPALDVAAIDDVYWGAANQAGEDNRNVARMAVLLAGLPVEIPGATVNRLCGSGMEAVSDAARAIAAGEADICLAGGSESMTRAPFVIARSADPFPRALDLADTRLGWRLVSPRMQELYPPITLGETAENVADDYHVSREDQDALAVESHRRAAAAAAAGYFTEQIMPVQVPGRKGTTTVDADEHIRAGVTLADLARLKPAFAKEGTVTAGNASGVNDAAAAVILADEDYAEQHGYHPIGRLVAYSHAGVEPRVMGIGPVPAVRKVLERADLKVDDIDVFEVNEAFAAQALAVAAELGLPPERTNPNGSGISLGHPLGATGAILVVKALYELRRTGGRYALVTMCIGGGQGIAAVFERI